VHDVTPFVFATVILATLKTLAFEVPYLSGSMLRKYSPDFILKVADGKPDPLNSVVEKHLNGLPRCADI
jgi:hypothetical protein